MADQAGVANCPACLLAEVLGGESRLSGADSLASEPGPKRSSAGKSGARWLPPDPADLAAEMPGYEVIALLGRGGMGAVYKARQINLDRLVAIKILPAALEADDGMGFVERFRQEARSMAKLSHPSIVAVHDFGQTPSGLLYFAMEFVEGMDIQQYAKLSGGRLDPDHALAICAHVLDALAYAHAKGIVHRDIKPANVLIDTEGRVRVADFGLAKRIVGEGEDSSALQTMTGYAMGTPVYMAPESLEEGNKVDHRADLYAVGVMLYQLLTGKLPQGIFRLPSEENPAIDARFDRLIALAMESSPDHRYQDADSFRRGLDEILSSPVAKAEVESQVAPMTLVREAVAKSGGGAPAGPARGGRAKKGKDRSTLAMIGGLGVLLAVGVGLATFLMRQQEAETPLVPATPGDGKLLPPATGGKSTSAPQERPMANPAPGRPADAAANPSPPLRVQGRFRAWSATPDDPGIELAKLAGVDDPAQVYLYDNGWVVLRSDGSVVGSGGGDGEKNIAHIARGHSHRFGLIDRNGKLRGFNGLGPLGPGEIPDDLGPVADAYIAEHHRVALLRDGSVRVWGQAFDGKKSETNPEWRKPSFPAGKKATAISCCDIGMAVQYSDGEVRVWRYDKVEIFPLVIPAGKISGIVMNTNALRGLDPSGKVLWWAFAKPSESPLILSPTDPGANAGARLVTSHALVLFLSQDRRLCMGRADAELAPEFRKVLDQARVDDPELVGCFTTYSGPASYKVLWVESNEPGAGGEGSAKWPADGPSFRRVGNFKAWQSHPDPAGFKTLDKLKGVNDVAQVYQAEFLWVVRRANGETISSDGSADRKGIAKIAPGFGRSCVLIGLDGRAEVVAPRITGAHRQSPPGLARVVDAYSGPAASFAITADGSFVTWGEAFDGIRTADNPEWNMRPTLPVGRKAVGLGGIDFQVSVILDDGRPLVWRNTDGLLQPPSFFSGIGFDQVTPARNRVFGIRSDGSGGTGWNSNGNVPELPEGASEMVHLEGAGAETVLFLDHDGIPHLEPEETNGELFKPVASLVKGARPGGISFRSHRYSGQSMKAWMLWFDGDLAKAPASSAPAPVSPASNDPALPAELVSRIANYQKARQTQLAELTGKFRTALETEKARAPAESAPYEAALAAVEARAAEISALPTKMEITALTALPSPPDSSPARLLELLRIFNEETAKIEQPLASALDQSLAVVETDFVRAERATDVKRVGSVRTALAKVFDSFPAALPAAGESAANDPAKATKDQPFVNSLGMKFVPVPIAGGPTSGKAVLFSVWETRVQDYEVFANDTKREWPKPLFEQGPTHPAVMVSWEDAKAFCAWLTDRERKAGRLGVNGAYRLPTDHEWSCAVGIGGRESATATPKQKDGAIVGVYPWGGTFPPPLGSGNYLGSGPTLIHPRVGEPSIDPSADARPGTVRVASFPPNPLGLCDLGGNVWEWCEERLDPDLPDRVKRGGSSYDMNKAALNSSHRRGRKADARHPSMGFRCVLEVSAPLSVESSGPARAVATAEERIAPSPAKATKDQPFVNSLGMKFVPVPGTKVLMCIHETRLIDYKKFFAEVPRENTRWRSARWGRLLAGFDDPHPVVSVTRGDAEAFCEWLSAKDGIAYRLPTDEEWSRAVGVDRSEKRRADTTPEALHRAGASEFPWGGTFPPPTDPPPGNFADATLVERIPDEVAISGYHDGFPATAPVMSFAPNALGIHDLEGNVKEWVADWWNAERKDGVFRGACYADHAMNMLRSSARQRVGPDDLRYSAARGFRVVLELP